jgi:hypothetical protein
VTSSGLDHPVVAGANRSPRVARTISIVPGTGQLYYGARKRAAQYFAGVALPLGLLVLLFAYNEYLTFHMSVLGSAMRLGGVLLLELIELTLLIIGVCFWIAASWDARQGTIARNEGRDYHPTWWYVKVKQFLFEDPEEPDRV